MVWERDIYEMSQMLKAKLISNIDPKNKNNKLNLVAKKNSLSEKMKKVKTLDEYITDLLNGGAMETKL